MNELQLKALAEQLAPLSGESTSTEKEQFKTKLRANICWLKPADNEKGYSPISLPFGIALELSPAQRAKQLPETLQLMDGLAAIAKALPEGTSTEINPVVGQICISIRHSGEVKSASNTELNNALAMLAQGLTKK